MRRSKKVHGDSTGELPTILNPNPRPGSPLAIYLAKRDYILEPLRESEEKNRKRT